jgi:light-regulated signal transduction histidine kinase (bacteriophytochrome)/CheY-like chemotaxis protein
LQTTDLTNCDREPIHIPGSIQPHGCLLACDAQASSVLRHSANAAEFLGLSSSINGRRLEELVGDQITHDVRNALSMAPEASRPAVLTHVQINDACFDICAHTYRGNVILEFERSMGIDEPLQLARELIGRIKDIKDINSLIKTSARLVRGVLGYDRVMIYRFDTDGSGKVISEAKRADLESFLGQYFPASDIPQQARKLYMQNPIRVISDASGERVRLVPELDASGEPLDLSFAHLRSVSPIHLEYLRNMGVGASMSISLIMNGELWGLIACHHYGPKTLGLSQRIAAEIFGEFLSLELLALRQNLRLNLSNHTRQSLDRFLQLASHHADVEELFRERLADFKDLIECDGIGLWMNGRWSSIGITPPAADIEPLMHFLSSVSEGQIWASHNLSSAFPPADAYFQSVSGVLAIPFSQIPKDYLVFFRKERLQTLNWAGNPEKSYTTGPLGDRLTPRKSFAIWKETVHRQSNAWSDIHREIAAGIRSVTVETVLRHNEIMQDERQKADVRQRILNEELNHRVKNILAVIKSLVGAPARSEQGLNDYVTTLKGRIQALSHAHDQVIRGSGTGQLQELLKAELGPYHNDTTIIHIDGPMVILDSRAYAVMALVIHELSTNAAKYGALSRPCGTLSVKWNWTEQGDCSLLWQESGGPIVGQPRRKGFGSALIDRSIPYDLGGQSTVRFEPSGLIAELALPSQFLSGFRQADSKANNNSCAMDASTMSVIDKTLPILLVEDQMLIAMDVEMMLSDAGFETVMTAGSAPSALAQLKNTKPAFAVLDINLGNHTSVAVAEELRRLGIPFVFATGYAEGSVAPESFNDVPVVNKPYESDRLLAAITNRLSTPSLL